MKVILNLKESFFGLTFVMAIVALILLFYKDGQQKIIFISNLPQKPEVETESKNFNKPPVLEQLEHPTMPKSTMESVLKGEKK